MRLVLQANGKEVELGEFFQALPRKQHGRVWAAVLPLAQNIAQRLREGDDGTGRDEETGEKVSYLLSLTLGLHLVM